MNVIERLEALTEPCREMDAAIALAIGKKATAKYGDHALGNDYTAPAYFLQYTKSIDAAMTLVPEGCENNMGLTWTKDIKEKHCVIANLRWLRVEATAHTPAIALCIAALKARNAK